MYGEYQEALAVEESLGDLQIPPELEVSFQRHRENVAGLVKSLRSAGINEAQIEQSVSVIVASYKEELIRAIRRIMQ